ncbi:MAG TPA: hypothetical protein VEC93_18665, partial [Anaerolineae bacterium]|nr:hypothetical protein [Anaerolineae bacterium]
MWQQMFPQSAWGTSYLTYKTAHPKGTAFQDYLNLYRIMVTDPTTVVKVNGTVLTNLLKGSFYEVQTRQGDFIEANKPIMVTQYGLGSNQCTGVLDATAYGDPEMFILTPMQQGIKSAVFYNTRRQNIDINYFDVIIHKNGVSSLRWNGNPIAPANIIPHPVNPDYVVAVVRLLGAGRQHTLRSDSAFFAKVYGFGSFESYGYNLGTMINNLNGIFHIDNIYRSDGLPNPFTCPYSPFTISVRLSYRASSIRYEFSKVTGLNISTDTTLNNPVPVDSILIGERKYYTYTLNLPVTANAPGIYEIPVKATAPEVDYCDNTEPLLYQLEVRPGPVSDFSINYSGCISDTARFTGTANPNGYTLDRYVWTHYDGLVDSAINSQKRFHGAGPSFPALYRVLATNGCLHDTTKLVTPTLVPMANFKVNKTAICLGDPLLITDSSYVTGTALVNWNWNLDDGISFNTNNGNPFNHTPPTSGSKKLSLWVETSNCRSDTFSVSINVSNRPTATFTVAGKPCVDSTMTYTSTA